MLIDTARLSLKLFCCSPPRKVQKADLKLQRIGSIVGKSSIGRPPESLGYIVVLEDLAKAANNLFANFGLLVLSLFSFILVLVWIIQWFEG